TSYNINSGDAGSLVRLTPTSVTSYTVTTSLVSGFFFWVQNYGTAEADITCSGHTFDGASTLVLQPGQGAFVMTDGSQYYTSRGGKQWSTTATQTGLTNNLGS